ncbi:MAG: flagellar filament capping protein FliD [Terriglobia bacterium]
MGSSISPLSSALAPVFTGISKFGSSLQQVLSRAVGIASLPLDSLNASLTTLNDKQSALFGLGSAFAILQNSSNALQNAVDTTRLNSSISDAGIASATVTSEAAPATYSLEVTGLGAYSTAISAAAGSPVSDPATQGLGATLPLTLNAGGASFTIAPGSSSLNALAAAINSQAGASVQATLVNTGSTASPNYRLSLRAVNLGTDAITLTDGAGGNLIESSTAGALATYKINGIATDISSTSRSVTLAPGVTVNLRGQSAAGQTTTITVSNSSAGIAAALSSFAQAYNTAVDAVNTNHGQSGGALQGDSILQAATSVLHRLGTFDNGTPSSALANYGITLDKSGKLTVDSSALTTAAGADFSGLLSVLGSSTGSGFLKSAHDLLSSIQDPVSGLIPSEAATVTSRISAQQVKIAKEQLVISSLQTNLTTQIAKADAAIAALESQVSYVTGLFGQYTGATQKDANTL